MIALIVVATVASGRGQLDFSVCQTARASSRASPAENPTMDFVERNISFSKR